MEKSFDKVWSNCLEIIKDIVEWQHFKTWFEPIKPVALKDKIRSAQIKAALSVSEQMIRLYWDIGKSIVEKQKEHNWGSKIIENMAKDLKSEILNELNNQNTNLSEKDVLINNLQN